MSGLFLYLKLVSNFNCSENYNRPLSVGICPIGPEIHRLKALIDSQLS